MTQHAYGCDGLHPGPCPSWIDRFTGELATAPYPDALSGGGAAVSLIGAALLRRLGVDLGDKPDGRVSFEYDEDGGIGPRVIVAFGEAREEAQGQAVLPDAVRLVAKHRDHALEVSLKLGRLRERLRELAESWAKADGWGDPTPEMRTEADCGREILAIIGTPEATS